jgi:antirestriction protein ArdC
MQTNDQATHESDTTFLATHEEVPGSTVHPVDRAIDSMGSGGQSLADAAPGSFLGTSPAPSSSNCRRKSPRGGVYDQVTKRIVDLLESGTVPWHKPWKAQTGLPRNLVSKRPYRGINVFLLLSMMYESPFWLTFNQANQLGGHIRQGEKACPVIFWKSTNVENKETGEPEKIRFLRFYYVFNLAQCEKLKALPPLSEQLATLPKPGEILDHMPKRPLIRHGMNCAFYSPPEDVVGMPFPDRFSKAEAYYSTLFHELIHSTGHNSRLDRPTLSEKAGYGSDPYCREELIAELGAAFLCGHAGIAERTVDNSAAYVKGWLGRLKADHKLILQAAAQAQAAADFILGTGAEEPAHENPSPTLP